MKPVNWAASTLKPKRSNFIFSLPYVLSYKELYISIKTMLS